MKNINVFVYGTLLSQGSNPAELMVNAEVVCPATAPGSIYDLGWYPGYKPSAVDAEEDDWANGVLGELIRVDKEGLERLDSYEGYPGLYTRMEIPVTTEDYETVPALVYVYSGSIHPDDIIPHGDWLRYEKAEEAD